MKTVEAMAILEIEGQPNGKDGQRYLNVVAKLNNSSVNGSKILHIITQHDDEPCRVKHYGYDFRCSNGCNHELASYGILRYFGVTLIIEHDPQNDANLFGTYQIDNNSHLIISGHTIPEDHEYNELKKIDDV